jgi:hypothetical protein
MRSRSNFFSFIYTHVYTPDIFILYIKYAKITIVNIIIILSHSKKKNNNNNIVKVRKTVPIKLKNKRTKNIRLLAEQENTLKKKNR